MDKDRKWFPDEQGAGMIPFELREGFGGRHAFSQEIIDEIRNLGRSLELTPRGFR